MLKLISYKDISTHSDLFFSQFQLRHREFIERQSYAVKSIDGMEFDEYDSLAAQYLVFTEDGRTVLGCSRLTPIDLGCMLADHFPDLVEDKSIFTAPRVWEGTRFCIDSRLPSETRRLICQSLAVGYIEFGLAHGIDQIIGLMPTLYALGPGVRRDLLWGLILEGVAVALGVIGPFALKSLIDALSRPPGASSLVLGLGLVFVGAWAGGGILSTWRLVSVRRLGCGRSSRHHILAFSL